MKATLIWLLFGIALAAPVSSPSMASPPTPRVSAVPQRVTVESYYRVRWGDLKEFKRLYEKNEATLLREMQRLGFISELQFDQPYIHTGGLARWDLRATITYRDAATAVEIGTTYDQAFEAARARLLPDKATYDAEEVRRFSLLEDHWDIIIEHLGH